MDYPYAEHADNVIHRYELKRKTAREYGDKPCPNCGGVDRFYINDLNGLLKHHCRQGCDDLERLKAMQRDGALPEATSSAEVVPYHQKKKILLLEARLEGDTVVVPLFDVLTSEKRGRQTIYPNGRKKFLKGMKKLNAGCLIGDKTDILYVCEGYAIAVAVHLSTGQQALFALDAKTLPKTVSQLEHPQIVIAADHDDEGIASAKATGKPYALPPNKGADWWDVFDRDGKEAVKAGLSSTYKQDFLEGFSITDGVELHNEKFKELVFLKKGFLPFPNLVLTAGAPKTGKSWFVLGLAEELTQNDHTVVYISNEDTTRRLQARYKKVSDFPSKKLVFISGISSKKPLPKGEAGLAFISALKRQYPDLKCVIVDTIQAIRNPDLKQDYANVENEFSAIRKLAHKLEITIIGVHHTKKTTDFETTPIDRILGSQAIAATDETIIILEQCKGSQDVNLFITGKDVEQNEEYRLHWTDHGFSEPEDKRLADRGPVQKDIITYVKNHPRCTQKAICEALEKSKQQINEAVNILLEHGILKSLVGDRLICCLY